jgi:hypothetical protein
MCDCAKNINSTNTVIKELKPELGNISEVISYYCLTLFEMNMRDYLF